MKFSVRFFYIFHEPNPLNVLEGYEGPPRGLFAITEASAEIVI